MHTTVHASVSTVCHVEAEMPKQKTKCIFGMFKGHQSSKQKVLQRKRLFTESGVCFLIWGIFDIAQCPLVDFKGIRDPLQQNGLLWVLVYSV